MLKKICTSGLFLVFFLISCGSQITPVPVPSETLEETATMVLATFTDTPIPPTATITPTPTETPVPPTATPHPHPTPGPLGIYAYEDFKGNTQGLIIFDENGESKVLITQYVNGHAWSPNGKSIAFFDYDESQPQTRLSVIDVNGRNELHLVTDRFISYNQKPLWTPDGQQIIAVVDSSIYLANADGSNVQTIQTHLSEKIYYFDTSPDGTQIVFSVGLSYRSEIYVIDITGENLTMLTYRSFPADAPAWSPDGAKIAFAGDTDVRRELYVMNADGTDVTQVGNNIAPYDPIWSPDGTHLAYYIWSPVDGTQQFCIIQIDGTNKFCVGGRVRVSIHPQAWSPDGSQIVFSLGEEEKNIFDKWVVAETRTYVVNADGTGLTEINALEGAWDVAWNPVGPDSFQPPPP